ncbi:hypothetical protein GW17_00027490 [Ensete ventricosum]|nr:hypothetical protein GW17_00027490 [Ensete ventricosum]
MRRERMVAMGAPERLRWGPKVSRWRRFYPRLFASAGPAEDLGVEEVGSFPNTHLVLTPSIDTLSAVCGRGPEAVGPGRCQEDRLRQARRWVKFWSLPSAQARPRRSMGVAPDRVWFGVSGGGTLGGFPREPLESMAAEEDLHKGLVGMGVPNVTLPTLKLVPDLLSGR